MASRRRAAFALTALLIIPTHVSALQVSPNSPCAPVCLDREDQNVSDPQSSVTRPVDITCKDGDYSKTATGTKWKRCMTCLEKSSFSQGSESDQGWFLYNTRYNFNYCVFGYPNNTEIGSNPCQTSRACGALKDALVDGNMDPEKSSEYGYCNADGNSMTGEFFDKCLTCIASFRDQVVVRNGLIALGAGCQQRPGPGKILGLNDTIFASTPVGILNGDVTNDSSHAQGGSTTPTTTMIIGIVSGVLVAGAIAGIIYVCVRKRRDARRRANAAQQGWDPATGYHLSHGGNGDNGPISPLSFRCQTNLSPTAPQPFDFSPVEQYSDDKSQPRQYITSTSRHPPNVSPVAESPGHFTHAHFSQMQQSEKEALGLHQLTTTALPAAPRNTHYSPHAGPGMMRGSPVSATPTSATQLLPGGGVAMYVPADYAGTSPIHVQQQHQPAIWQQQSSPPQQWGWPGQPTQQPQQPQQPQFEFEFPQHRPHQSPPAPSKSPKLRLQRKGSMEKSSQGLKESMEIQTSFPGPPGKR
ncbi:hypothetical protein MGG_07521 [Pyricularia oryzae 70-15]|uniref:LPXTG-domain-containing protein n=1 Tax=Pyricularia oryzae (strain 70-15 / ATCC MYA-4617 / FGSC 8958) TaxID=242507 RepID=G4N1Q5_PYRO7|nr:uncharacterized protein MGG_07521 [Pyricularia oryzae 70-15]EHA51627.1 hypothetical protein MGG_07521 [Pyricularia oryzae 70-15]KAI7926859.1 hypothetical protein M9X92_002598 [Pyricularia oryzae]